MVRQHRNAVRTSEGNGGLTIEEALYVHSHDVVPTLVFRDVVEGRSPRGARVVDEDVESLGWFELGEG